MAAWEIKMVAISAAPETIRFVHLIYFMSIFHYIKFKPEGGVV